MAVRLKRQSMYLIMALIKLRRHFAAVAKAGIHRAVAVEAPDGVIGIVIADDEIAADENLAVGLQDHCVRIDQMPRPTAGAETGVETAIAVEAGHVARTKARG